MDWADILKTLGTNSILLVVLGFVARSIFTAMLSKDVDKYRMQIQANYEKEIERLKADLNRQAAEHQIRFSKLHEKRAEVIAKIYELIVEAEEKCRLLIAKPPISTSDELSSKLTEITMNLDPYLRRNKIYLDSELCSKLECFEQKLIKVGGGFAISKTLADPDERKEMVNMAVKEYHEKLPEIKEELENRFRILLGD
jgi:hypothetical protein